MFDSRATLDDSLDYISRDATASAMVNNARMNSACLVESGTNIALIAAEKRTPATPVPQRTITEDELFQALTEYRRAHQVSELHRDDKLCEYARKRVEDHLALFAIHKPKEEYPVPGKYPLDAHAGFKADGDSGLVFDVTGKSKVAENLAYWPTAQYGIHVIEWGWDTSTEGHRETQLSNEYDSACVSGKQGFFVAIFGK